MVMEGRKKSGVSTVVFPPSAPSLRDLGVIIVAYT
uniref:Uncharacterized protein n=1 Tax=Arundo donax TaxID=35708 RepID=A0A0A9A7K5_ARUDO